MNETIDYYNSNAEQYYKTTVGVDFGAMRRKFASYLPVHASIVDVGCGSGRDVLAFCEMGFDAIGLDASEELVKLAQKRLGIRAEVIDMSTWVSEEPVEGIWSCASLIHLTDDEKACFFNNLQYNLKPGGIIYISVKDGIETGMDEEGRYMSNCPEEELRGYLEKAGCKIVEILSTRDLLDRNSFRWLNIIANKRLN